MKGWSPIGFWHATVEMPSHAPPGLDSDSGCSPNVHHELSGSKCLWSWQLWKQVSLPRGGFGERQHSYLIESDTHKLDRYSLVPIVSTWTPILYTKRRPKSWLLMPFRSFTLSTSMLCKSSSRMENPIHTNWIALPFRVWFKSLKERCYLHT